MEETKKRNPDYVDAKINLAQRQYIQPVARVPGEAYYTTTAEEIVEGEALTTADGGLTYSFTYTPVRRGSLTIYDASGDEIEEGAANYPTVDYDNGTLTFAVAEAGVTADYTNVVVVALSTIATDIYRINFIVDITSSTIWNNVNNLPDFEAEKPGVRLFNDKVYFHGLAEDRTLLFGYHKKLTDLSATNQTPEIEEQWHDLYWLGGIALIDLNRMPLFLDRLREFKLDRLDEVRPHGQKLKIKGWW